ncbi:MAG: CHAT domain-containing protein [Gemmataceae bacterium]|nr:CHAT domain-containing protein [Gemmataceae bacterium]
MVEGAHHWHRLLGVPLAPADFRARSSDLHLHMRTLAGLLLEAGRTDEAFVAFETGRALGYAVDVDSGFFSRVVQRNPFPADGGCIDLGHLQRVQERLRAGEAAVVLAVVPPRLAAFVVGSDSVRCVAVDAVMSRDCFIALDSGAKMVPHLLAKDAGLSAVPKALLGLAQGIVGEVGKRTVVGFVPFDSLHMVPWRAVLRECGLPWDQLAFPTGFSSLLWHGQGRALVTEGIALGHGEAAALDLKDEARRFATAFGGRGRFVENCTAGEIRQALGGNAAVLLSCHGSTRHAPGTPRLVLELGDGPTRAEDVFPERVSAPVVLLSACDSGVYHMAWSDYPVGAAPDLLRRGAGAVICARFPIRAAFAGECFPRFGSRLAEGVAVEAAFAQVLQEMECEGADRWRDLACLELLKAN